MDSFLRYVLEIATYVSFILIGLVSLIPRTKKTEKESSSVLASKAKSGLGYIFVIAFSIVIR